MPVNEYSPLTQGVAQVSWSIQESVSDLEALASRTQRSDSAYKIIRHPNRQRTWLAARLAFDHLLQRLDMPALKLCSERTSGRPYIQDSTYWVSIAHTRQVALVALSIYGPVGVDVEAPTPRMHLIRSRFLHPNESDIPHTPEALCMLWCVKEAVYKAAYPAAFTLKQIHVDALQPLNALRWEAFGTSPSFRFKAQIRLRAGHFEARAQPLYS